MNQVKRALRSANPRSQAMRIAGTSVCAVLLLAAVMGFGNPAALATSAEAQNNGADGTASPSGASDLQPALEDFAGEYTCTTIMFGSDVVPLQDRSTDR